MKVLILGSGGREHAMYHTIAKKGHSVVCLPGNAGTTAPESPKFLLTEQEKLADFAATENIDLTIVGPEAPLASGIANFFKKRGLTIFAPSREASQLESSKVWAKEFMTKYDLPTAPYHIFDNLFEALEKVGSLIDLWQGVVIKPDGLTAGKGVIPCDTLDEANAALKILMEEKKYGSAAKRVIIEKKLTGPEVSILAICDGKTIVPMVPSQDHKRLLEQDRGPNTGGVGAYAPLPIASALDFTPILEKTLEGLKSEGISYTGVIYFGLMLTDDGPQLLEYNCRFGDPEAQVVLPLLDSDLAEILFACCQGQLEKRMFSWSEKSACCVVMTSQGYPETFTTGHEITGLDTLSQDEELICFHSGTRFSAQGRIITSGGRVLGITALADTLEQAREKAYNEIEKIHFVGACYRKDIAYQAL